MQGIEQIFTDIVTWGYIGVFVACFLINLLPFGPSNMVMAGIAALALHTLSWIIIGVIVAFSAVLAKLIHYWIVRGSRMVLSENSLAKLDREKQRVEKWGALALFFAAASPFPDDPIIVYVALTKYNILKLTLSYFTGKVIVTLAGAFLGYIVGGLFDSLPLVIGSVALTLIITAYLFLRTDDSKESELNITTNQE
ncbi:MAG: VTT domain-containing protein [Candidatus Thorarchaeota archaeon]|jgi:membrane protein YqaA with SNARE-associated domain